MAIDFNDLKNRATSQLNKLKDKASGVDVRGMAETAGSTIKGAARGIADKLHKQPYWLTVPTATAGGVMLSRALKGDQANTLSDIMGALGGAAGGAVLGKAISTPKDFGPLPRHKISDLLTPPVGPIGPIGGAIKHVAWDAWGPMGKTLIPAAAAMALAYKFNIKGFRGVFGGLSEAASKYSKGINKASIRPKVPKVG